MAKNVIKRVHSFDPGGVRRSHDTPAHDPAQEKSLVIYTKATTTRKPEKPEYDCYNNNRSYNLEIMKPTGALNHFVKLSTLIERKLSQVSLIEGKAGIGKSTCLSQLVDTYKAKKQLQMFNYVIKITVREDDPIFANDIPELAEALQLSEQELRSLKDAVETNGDSCLVLVDFCGYLGDNAELKQSSFLFSIISRKIMIKATIVVTCQPLSSDYIHSVGKIEQVYTLKGFVPESAKHFIKSNAKHSKSILAYLDQHHLNEICSNPRICKALVKMSQARSYSEPNTLSEFLYRLVIALLQELLTPEERDACLEKGQFNFEKLPERIEGAFGVICKLAMQHLLVGHHNKTREESSQFLSSFALQLPKVSLEKSFLFGLVDSSVSDSRHVYQFISPVLMEFLAAFYLYKQKPPFDQLRFLYYNAFSLFSSKFVLWLRFFHGLVGTVSTTTIFNPAKLMINTVNEVLADSLRLSFEPQHRVSMVMCLLETQENSIVRKLAAKLPGVLDLSIAIAEFEPLKTPCVKLINASAIEWLVTTSKDHLALAEEVKSRCSKVKVEIKVDESAQADINISPKNKPADHEVFNERHKFNSQTAEEKVRKLNQFCCRACREILQRILPLYSKVKIKADSTNVSYVSFLTCGCFEKSFLENVRMFPTQSIHFLTGKKRVEPTSDLDKLNPTDRHNLTVHNGFAMEVVLMLRPQLRRIECVVPDTSQEFSITLSSGELSVSVESVSEFTTESSIFVPGVAIQNSSYQEGASERVLPPLPVVQKHSRSQTQAPKPFLPPMIQLQELAYLPKIAEEPSGETSVKLDTPPAQKTEGEGLPYLSSRGSTSQSPANLHRPDFQGGQFPVYESHGNVASMNLTPMKRSHLHSAAQARPESSIQPSPGVYVQPIEAVQPQQAKRQEAMRAGTVLFSSIPSKIPYDQIQPLPDQSVLIRKGGNGSIFSVIIKDTPMAVKKTSYRSKEYSIITKIRHKNVVPLLAFIWGEEHEVNKRRYYVYHFLPKMSGDLARLLTDKEELSLSEYYKTHKMDPLALGLAMGNIKYTLTQILEAIQYLHDQHIAHRDLKASNVLIKFYCGCDNILQCGCDQKYQVLICDFDAAIELDPSDCLPPAQSQSSRTPVTSQHVEVVPVGTNGFRSPESSSLIIASSVAALDPQVSTKTDIFSLGMLSLRLMLCTGTPYSQRAMSTLLLYYYQSKGKPEGRVRGLLKRGLVVDESTANRILKLTKLRPRMEWAPGAYDFVSSCVAVDPEARPSATQLLTHPFLN